ncbi:hypothetical protein ACTFIR_011864 [Dictyostelium discoideum]
MDTLDYANEQRQLKRDPNIIKQDIISKENEWKQTMDEEKKESIKQQILILTDELNAPDQDEHKKFIDDFNRWLVRRGNAEDHSLTPWARTPLSRAHHSIGDYLSEMLKRIDFLIDIKRLKDSVQFESITLEKAYLYFKYIVRGKMNDPNTLGYYSEMDSMFSKLTREEKNSYGFNDSSADALDNYNSYDFSGLPQKVLGSKDHLPEIISEFTTLLKSRDLQNLTTGTKADDPDYINQGSIILEQRIRRNNLYYKLNEYRKERKDISDAYEKEEKIQNTDHLYSLIEKQANEEKKVETIYSRLNNFNSGYFETNLSKYHVSEIEQEISKDYLFKELKKNIPIESLPISRLLKNTFTNDEDNKTINEFLQNGKTKWIEKIEELNNMYFSQDMDKCK